MGQLIMIAAWPVLFLAFQLLQSSSAGDVEEAIANLREFNEMWDKMKKGKHWTSDIPYADIKAYSDLTIPELGTMYDAGIKSYVFKYFVGDGLAIYKKYLFQRVIDEWFLHVPCYSMRNIAEGSSITCPPPSNVGDKEKEEYAGSICITDNLGCNMVYHGELKMHVISLDDLRRCGPGKVYAFIAKALGARSPIQEPDRNEHVTVNFENVELGMTEDYLTGDGKWRKGFPMLMEDLDYCRRTTEEVYSMKTSVFKKGIFDYSSVLVPETFQYSDPIDPRPVTVAKEIYEQVSI